MAPIWYVNTIPRPSGTQAISEIANSFSRARSPVLHVPASARRTNPAVSGPASKFNAIWRPSGDHANWNGISMNGPSQTTFSAVPSVSATSNRDRPTTGLFPRPKAIFFPSGENAIELSMSRTINCGLPPSTGVRIRLKPVCVESVAFWK